MLRFLEAVVVLLALAVAGAMLAGRMWPDPSTGFYARLAALAQMPADGGSVDFEKLARRATPNQALACPERLCLTSRPDVLSPVFPVPAEELARLVQRVVDSEPDSGTLYCAPDCKLYARYVEYSPMFRFPDIIDVVVLPAGAKASTLAIYSRSLFGYWDFDVNRTRVNRWLAALERIMPSS